MSQARGVGLHEANDVSWSELTELNLTVAEDVPEKTPNRIAVQTNRRSGEPTLAQQILLKILSHSTSWRNRNGLLGACDVPIRCNESGEPVKRKDVAASASSLQPTIIKVVSYMVRPEAAVLDSMLIEPGHEVIHQPGRCLYRCSRISLSLHLLDKNLNER